MLALATIGCRLDIAAQQALMLDDLGNNRRQTGSESIQSVGQTRHDQAAFHLATPREVAVPHKYSTIGDRMM